jgi:hypothetical protein
MGVIALRTRTLTDDAFPGHASSHGQFMHMGPGSYSARDEGDNHSGGGLTIPTRLPESGGVQS